MVISFYPHIIWEFFISTATKYIIVEAKKLDSDRCSIFFLKYTKLLLSVLKTAFLVYVTFYFI